MEPLWKETPSDIVHWILQYDGRIKKRNGVYINQIPLERYALLRTIPQKEFFGTTLSSRNFMVFNDTIVNETFVHFRHKRDENNQYYTIYFQEQLDSPCQITHHFTKNFFSSMNSFVLP